jgi:hypothetical protein
LPLETATYIDDLVTTNPAPSDGMNNADDHMRMIKATLKNTFPGGVGPLTNADGGFLAQTDGAPTAPAYSFASEPTLGIYRSSAGVMKVVGGRLSGGADTGSVQMFLNEPASLGKVTADTGKDYLELNGATYNVTAYPALANFLGVASGTFTLPDMYTTGRFPRSRTAATAVRTAQADTVGPHTHPDVTPTTAAETQEHTHTFSGTTGVDSPDHTHGYNAPTVPSATGGGSFALQMGGNSGTTSGASTRHQHSFSGTTSGRSATHNHTVLVSTPANIGTTETRPVAMSFVFAVKT